MKFVLHIPIEENTLARTLLVYFKIFVANELFWFEIASMPKIFMNHALNTHCNRYMFVIKTNTHAIELIYVVPYLFYHHICYLFSFFSSSLYFNTP